MINYDFKFTQGEDWSWMLEGFPTLEGASFTMQIRADKNRASELFLDATPYFTIVDNTLRFLCPKEVTETLTFSNGYYDIFYSNGQFTTRLLYGCVNQDNQITYLEAE